MHRVKGLEFRHVVIAGVQVGTIPLDTVVHDAPDKASRDALLAGERHLLHVAATRPRDELVVTGFGKKS